MTTAPGFPDHAEVVDMYATVSGRDISELHWYVAFAAFKLAVISAGIAARVRAGTMIGDGHAVGGAVRPLVDYRLEVLLSRKF